MAQGFYPTFSSSDQVQTTMSNIQDTNCNSLRSNFSGTSAPGTPVASQFFSNTTSGQLEIRNQDNLTWDGLYDFTGKKIILATGNVESAHINSTARKGSIVTGEAIAPASCTLQAQFATVSLPAAACELFPLFTTPTATSGFGVITSATPTWDTLITSRVYIPADAGTLYVICYQVTCDVRLTVSTQTDTTGSMAGPGWGSDASVDLSALSGWQSITIEGQSTQASSPYGGIGGIAFRWEN